MANPFRRAAGKMIGKGMGPPSPPAPPGMPSAPSARGLTAGIRMPKPPPMPGMAPPNPLRQGALRRVGRAFSKKR